MATLYKTIKNVNGFDETIEVLKGSAQYLENKLDEMSDDVVIAFYIEY